MRDEVLENRLFRIEVDGDDLAAFGAFLRGEEQPRADVSDQGPCMIERGDQRFGRPPILHQINDGNAVAASKPR